MKPTNYFLLFIFALTLTVPSCKKDETIKSVKEILTSKSWKMSSSKQNGVEIIEDCTKDDIITFATDGTFTTTVGSTTCYYGETGNSGTWTLSSDGKTLTIDEYPASVSISESKITVTSTDGTDTLVMTFIPA
jgi:hypothetical protein